MPGDGKVMTALEVVKNILDADGQKNPFSDSQREWYKAFVLETASYTQPAPLLQGAETVVRCPHYVKLKITIFDCHKENLVPISMTIHIEPP